LNNSNHESCYVFVGSYAEESNQALYWYIFDRDTCSLQLVDSVSEIPNPSFLTIDRDQHFLYAVSETSESKTCEGGSIVSYSISKATGKLLRLNEKLSLGDLPCNLIIGHEEQFLFFANYSGGSVGMFSIEDDGEIGELEDLVQHKGQGIHPDRQEKAHPHAVVLDRQHKYLFVPDLGIDQIVIYHIDYFNKKLIHHEAVKLPPGSGPRHFVINSNSTFAYCINELSSSVTVFSYKPEEANLQIEQTIPTLPDDFMEESTCAEIVISPSGRHLYASNRGHDSITAYEINPSTGLLTFLRHTSTEGKTPRNFSLTPDGQFLLVANQDSHSIVAFEVNASTGELKSRGTLATISNPNFVKIVAQSAP